jgi:cellulose synthase/poly-beta-1,6-N-acetylglucosamine synthase-like glycosyltransferase
VVIPTYNEAAIIENRLANLLETTYPAEQLEILLADDSTDETAVRARSFFKRTQTDATLRVLDTGNRGGVAAALNETIPAASGEVVFRTDADAKLAPDAIPKAVAVLADPSVSAVTGRQADVIGGSVVESDYRNLLSILQSVETCIDSTFIVHGPCFAFRRAEFEPLAVDTIADDTAIAVQLRRNGGRVVMDPAIEFVEGGSSSLSGRRTRKDRRAVGLLQQLFRHRDALGHHGRYGWIVLPLNWGLMIVGPWLLAVTAAVATLLGTVAAGPVGLLVPIVGGVFLLAGSRELLGPLQPLHAVVDAYLSLLIASMRLLRGDVDVKWNIDDTMREGL